MEARAPSSSYCTHVETRLSFDSVESPIVHIQLPSTSAFTRTTKATRKVLSALPTSKTEEEYRHRRVATSSNVFFRSKQRFPRSILWRCLEDNKTVELRALDLSKKDQPKEKDSNLAIRLAFPIQIARDGIAVADSSKEDTICLFVITTGGEFYTISLKSIFFSRSTASEDDFDRYVKIFKPSSFSIAAAFRLQAVSAHEVLISLLDGRLLRLTRQIGSDGSHWVEAAYTDGQWASSFRGLIPWTTSNNSINYEGTSLDYSTALNFVKSPDNEHLISIGINHTIKFWDLQTGKANVTRDLTNTDRDPSAVNKILIHPSTQRVVRTFQCQPLAEGDLYYVVTYSPHSSGIFKFWRVRDANNDELGVRDLFEDEILRAPEPDDGALWTLSDFHVQADPQSSGIDVWIVMRLNRRYKTYRRRFDDLSDIEQNWSHGWSMSLVEPAKKEPGNEPPVKITDMDCQPVPERWLEWLTSPGRYTVATLETALVIFTGGQRSVAQRNTRLSIKDRLAATIGSQIYLSRSGRADAVDEFEEQISQEWTKFWKIVVEIDQSQWEPLAFVLDEHEGAPYSILGNGFAVLRDLSELEKVAYNTPASLKDNVDSQVTRSIEMETSEEAESPPDLISAIIATAARFRNSFSSTLEAAARSALQDELWKESSAAIPDRIQAFFDTCDFESEVSDKTYNGIGAGLKAHGGLQAIKTHVTLHVLGQLPAEQLSQSVQKPGVSDTTRLGIKVRTHGVLDSIAVQERVTTDLLLLLVFLAVDGDSEELSDSLNVNMVYGRFLDDLRRTQLVKWLATQTVMNKQQDLSALPNAAYIQIPLSVLERDVASCVHPRLSEGHSLSAALTISIRDIQIFACGEDNPNFDEVLVNLQGGFLVRKQIDLASSFAQFQPSSALSTYVKGRLHLARQEFSEAAHHFKKAAFNLTQKQGNGEWTERSAGLIRVDEQNFFGNGFTNYYSHIMDLFVSQQVYVEVINFAELALQHSHTSEKVQHSNLLARLFSAALAIMEYSTAYAALVRYTDQALQRKSLEELTTRMVADGHIEDLLSLPLTTLKKTMEKILTDKAAKEVGLSINTTPAVPYFKILYAFHVRHKNFRAAASVLVSRLEARHERRVKNAKQHRFLNTKQEAEKALDEYLVGINALALLSPDENDDDAEDEAWVFVEGDSETGKKRRVMRIEGLRERYQSEMDRVGAIELGRWGIIDDDENEDDGMDGIEINGTSNGTANGTLVSI